jgi:hypothetical protein
LVLFDLIVTWERLWPTWHLKLFSETFEKNLFACNRFLHCSTWTLYVASYDSVSVPWLITRLQDEDVDEFYNGSGISWKVGPHEARAIASLKMWYRVD